MNSPPPVIIIDICTNRCRHLALFDDDGHCHPPYLSRASLATFFMMRVLLLSLSRRTSPITNTLMATPDDMTDARAGYFMH
ncbi:hypothetical protein EDWATA_01917 [Edwardsiella tarda ATCC 23685]|uniref:Uncharacterized protein n=1 Tax=Edwardsiella tarda ATCC 23685 TaxID=500638 RepID=D4F589_EDWTA|nr:hypothetical protein EDWATA_01917 [Edwardsiella tarda ATCC 23685]